MFKPLFWMFKTEGFKDHILYLMKANVFFAALLSLAALLHSILIDTPALVSGIIFLGLLLIQFLLFQGYFWVLTECVINRSTDITASDIYNGKTKKIYKISLPKISTKKFIWRGAASIIATALLIYPLILFFVTSSSGAKMYSIFSSQNNSLLGVSGCLIIFIGLFIPALLWNYARRDSIFAVWNVPFAVHIMGNYTLRYIFNTLMFVLFSYIFYLIINMLIFVTGIQSIISNSTPDIVTLIKFLIFIFITYTIYPYWMYVNAYILGTIAPEEEA